MHDDISPVDMNEQSNALQSDEVKENIDETENTPKKDAQESATAATEYCTSTKRLG